MMMFDVTERRLLDRLLDSSPAKSERLMMMMIMLDWDVAFVTAPNFLFFYIFLLLFHINMFFLWYHISNKVIFISCCFIWELMSRMVFMEDATVCGAYGG